MVVPPRPRYGEVAVAFRVQGSDRAELEARAREQLDRFFGDLREYAIDEIGASPVVETWQGTVELWEGRVRAHATTTYGT